MKIELILKDEPLYTDTIYHAINLVDRIKLYIYMDEKTNVIDELLNKKRIIKYLKKDDKDIAKYINDNIDNIYDAIDYISFEFKNINEEEYIKNNVNILNKKMVISNYIDINDYDLVMSLCNKYKEVINNVYIITQGNNEPVNLKKYLYTIIKIRNYTNRIKALELSPMESIMYIYDDLKEKIYQEENDEEDNKISRDLSEVLFNDKIVCEGYANIFAATLNNLNINNSLVYLKFKNNLLDKDGNEIGHVRNCVYINDAKYNIDGVYYFDVTFDSKQSIKDKIYLYKYNYFAKTKEEIDKLDREKDLYFNNSNTFMDIDTIYENVVNKIKKLDFQGIHILLPTINFMSRIINKENILDVKKLIDKNINVEQFATNFKEIIKKFDKQISTETMIKVFNNLKKVKYYNDEISSYSIEDLYIAYKKSNWNHLDESNKNFYIFKIIFKEEYDLDKEVFIDIINRNNIYKDIKQTQLIKSLKLYLNNKR